jgi:hypothetical protein
MVSRDDANLQFPDSPSYLDMVLIHSSHTLTAMCPIPSYLCTTVSSLRASVPLDLSLCRLTVLTVLDFSNFATKEFPFVLGNNTQRFLQV